MDPDPDKIREFLVRMTKTFGNEFITIGGWAVNAYGCKGKSLDGDAMISFQVEGCLRDSYLVEKNPRMRKSQLLCEVGCDIDLYVEHQHSLPVPFDEAQAYCREKNGLIVPAPEHLIILKLQAYKERQFSPKGHKDAEDLIQMLGKLEFVHPEIICAYFGQEEFDILQKIVENVTISLRVCGGNALEAKNLRKQAEIGLETLYKFTQSHEKQASPS